MISNLLRAALATATFSFAPGALTAQSLNLLVMGEDADLASVERHTPVFDRVIQAISDEMQARGFAVYDETAVTKDMYDLGRVRRTDAELISLAQSVQLAPIDAVTAIEIHVSVEDSAYEGIQDLRLRINGRMVEISNGRSLGGYEVSYRPGDLPMLPLDCHRPCLLGFVGDQASRIAKDVGAELATHLAKVTGGTSAPVAASACVGVPNAFTLTFSGFAPEELTRVDGFLRAFKGYNQHRVLDSGIAGSAYWYETCADSAKLEQNLRVMFEQLGTDFWLESDGEDFSVTRLALPAGQ